jgi:hypothetical protein
VSRIFILKMAEWQPPSWRMPTWRVHAKGNRFVETDIWIHDAERFSRGARDRPPLDPRIASAASASAAAAAAATKLSRGAQAAATEGEEAGDDAVGRSGLRGLPYAMPTTSDAGVLLFRRWWARSGLAHTPGFGPAPGSRLEWLPRAQQLDRHAAHIASCAVCQRALRNAERAKAVAPLLALVPLALCQQLPLRALGVLLAVATRIGACRAIEFIGGAAGPRELRQRVMHGEHDP